MWRLFLQMMFQGRYGFDQLGRLLLICSLFCELAALLLRHSFNVLPLHLLALALLLLVLWRMFSRNIEARAREARLFQSYMLSWQKRWRSLRYDWPRLWNGEYLRERRQYKFLRCQRCAARLRLPRGKGRVKATCPRCGYKIETKT